MRLERRREGEVKEESEGEERRKRGGERKERKRESVRVCVRLERRKRGSE